MVPEKDQSIEARIKCCKQVQSNSRIERVEKACKCKRISIHKATTQGCFDNNNVSISKRCNRVGDSEGMLEGIVASIIRFGFTLDHELFNTTDIMVFQHVNIPLTILRLNTTPMRFNLPTHDFQRFGGTVVVGNFVDSSSKFEFIWKPFDVQRTQWNMFVDPCVSFSDRVDSMGPEEDTSSNTAIEIGEQLELGDCIEGVNNSDIVEEFVGDSPTI
ncbi:hypothetical protein BC832DRAFT_538915 [Gaertneriomyces semiglobifer]|nr:hypothetical protein BC832DRAFT_538915 [Gaertneriomyces semiglobifer]